ncbi:MAG: histidine phosphatase family protein [Lysinibacillus sp.]
MNRSLLDSLRKGGFILYARHGEANIGSDLPHVNFQDCLTQRNLSAYGRWQAAYYGGIIRYWQIPIESPVSASPFCRTVETAQLAFGNSAVQVDPFWVEINRLSENAPNMNRQGVLNQVTSILEQTPGEGRNKVIVAHGFPEGVGLGQIPYMGTVVVKPKGKGNGYDIVGRLSLADWSTFDS